MLALLSIALGVAFGSALCPVISVEVFLVGTMADRHQAGVSCWAIGAVIAIGQVVGKLIYFYSGRGVVRLPNFLHPRAEISSTGPARETRWLAAKRHWSVRFGWLRARCEKHPGLLICTTTVSALTGLPPFAATTVLAGVARMSVVAFLFTSLAGRFLRFTAIAAAPALLISMGLLPHLA